MTRNAHFAGSKVISVPSHHCHPLLAHTSQIDQLTRLLTRIIRRLVIMPKEKATRKAKKPAESGKKKKGTCSALPRFEHVTNQDLDPNAPKRGLSAYMFFANEQRDGVRAENPNITFGETLLKAPSNASLADHCIRLQVKSVKPLARNGRPSQQRRRSRMKRKQRPTRIVMSLKSRATTLVHPH